MHFYHTKHKRIIFKNYYQKLFLKLFCEIISKKSLRFLEKGSGLQMPWKIRYDDVFL